MSERSVTVKLRVQDDFSASVDRYNSKMAQAEQQTGRMAQASSRVGQSFNAMGAAMSGAIVGFGIAGVTRLAEGLYSAGMNAQRAETLFQSFGAQVGSTTALLERLRGTTRGVVDDTTLM